MKVSNVFSSARKGIALAAFTAVTSGAVAQGINKSVMLEYVDNPDGRTSYGINNSNLWDGTFGASYEFRDNDQAQARAQFETDFVNRFNVQAYYIPFKKVLGGDQNYSAFRLEAHAGAGGFYRNNPNIEGEGGLLVTGRVLATVTVADRLEVGGAVDVTTSLTLDRAFTANTPITSSARLSGVLAWRLHP